MGLGNDGIVGMGLTREEDHFNRQVIAVVLMSLPKAKVSVCFTSASHLQCFCEGDSPNYVCLGTRPHQTTEMSC